MKLHLIQAEGRHLVTGYGSGWIEIDATRHFASLILTPHQLLTDWPVGDFEALSAGAFQPALALNPEILLLGTGDRLRFPAAAVLQPLIDAKLGYEVMSTAAACRTYNILMAEGRRVAAALIL
ncbi:MAG: Mth938-like domain-containing protein [Methylophilaceae bacterium]|nr:Mth938-like domain-containing protein [Methylophilaceae bacterium]